MSRTHRHALRPLLSVLLVVAFTIGSLQFNRRGLHPPHGHPLVFALAMSWLVAIGIAMLTAIIKFHPKFFSLAKWEKGGQVYDCFGVGAFRWVILHSPLGWINGNLHLNGNRTDCQRVLREIDIAEWVHWVTFASLSVLALWYLANGHAAYAVVLFLVRVPFDLYPIMLQRRNRGRVQRVIARHGASAETRERGRAYVA